MTDVVHRFLSQDDTQDMLQQLEQESQAYLHELQERNGTLQVHRSAAHTVFMCLINQSSIQWHISIVLLDAIQQHDINAVLYVQALLVVVLLNSCKACQQNTLYGLG